MGFLDIVGGWNEWLGDRIGAGSLGSSEQLNAVGIYPSFGIIRPQETKKNCALLRDFDEWIRDFQAEMRLDWAFGNRTW